MRSGCKAKSVSLRPIYFTMWSCWETEIQFVNVIKNKWHSSFFTDGGFESEFHIFYLAIWIECWQLRYEYPKIHYLCWRRWWYEGDINFRFCFSIETHHDLLAHPNNLMWIIFKWLHKHHLVFTRICVT